MLTFFSPVIHNPKMSVLLGKLISFWLFNFLQKNILPWSKKVLYLETSNICKNKVSCKSKKNFKFSELLAFWMFLLTYGNPLNKIIILWSVVRLYFPPRITIITSRIKRSSIFPVYSMPPNEIKLKIMFMLKGVSLIRWK